MENFNFANRYDIKMKLINWVDQNPFYAGLVVGIIITYIIIRLFLTGTRNQKHKLYTKQQQLSRKLGPLPPFYPNGWFKLASSNDLKVGDVKYVQALGMHFAVYRGHDGKAAILDAYCPHLGANLAVGGTVEDNCLRCPFHGWEFRSDCKCTKIPYSDKVPEMAKVTSYPVEEINGGVFVWYHAEGITKPSWKIPIYTELHDGTMRFVAEDSKHIINCHVQEIPENGADVAHLNILHTDSVVPYTEWCLSHKWSATWKAGENENEHIAFLELDHWLQFFGKTVPYTKVHATVKQVGPGSVFLKLDSAVGKLLMAQSVTPIAVMKQQVIHTIYAEKWVPNFFARIVFYAFITQFDRDGPIWNNKTYQVRPLLVKEDGNINQFRRWYTKFYSSPENVKKESIIGSTCTDW